MLRPKNTKYKKLQKGRINFKTSSITKLNFGSFGLKALESGRITSDQIESVRINISRKVKKLGKIWINIFPSVPITSKPSEVRMGKGKGNTAYWVSNVSCGKIMFEVVGQDNELVYNCLKSAANKLPLKVAVVRRFFFQNC